MVVIGIVATIIRGLNESLNDYCATACTIVVMYIVGVSFLWMQVLNEWLSHAIIIRGLNVSSNDYGATACTFIVTYQVLVFFLLICFISVPLASIRLR